MTRFLHDKHRTPEYEKAVDALRAVSVKHRGLAYAEACSENARALWMATRDVKRSSGTQWWARLIGANSSAQHNFKLPLQLPGDDHVDLWIKNGKPHRYTSQPYGLGLDTLRKMLALCDRYGMEVDINAWPAWHFPHSTLFVEYKKAEPPKGEPDDQREHETQAFALP